MRLKLSKQVIAKCVQNYRMVTGMTQTQLADELGISQREVSKIENMGVCNQTTMINLFNLGVFKDED